MLHSGRDVDGLGGCACGRTVVIQEIFILSAQYGYEPKTSLKNKILNKKPNIRVYANGL